MTELPRDGRRDARPDVAPTAGTAAVSTVPGTAGAIGSPAENRTVAIERPAPPAERATEAADAAGTDPATAPTATVEPAAVPEPGEDVPHRPRTDTVQGHLAHHRTVAWHRNATGPVPVVPGDHPGGRLRKVVGRTLSKTWNDSIFGWSSQAAFWCALSTAPLLLALLGMVGFVVGWYGPGTAQQVETQVLTFLSTIFPKEEIVDPLLAPTVHNLLTQGQADVVSVGFVISLWAGSSAISAFVEAITIAYGQHEVRHPVVERFFALGLYLFALVCGIFVLPLAAIGPTLLPQLFPAGWRDTVTTVVDIAYFPVLGIFCILGLTTLYKVAPKHRHPWKRGIPGAVLATIFFLVASHLLRIYIAYVTTHGLSYGALATPIVFLLFYYFLSMSIILGAQFNNATLEYYPPKRSRREVARWRRLDAEQRPAQARQGAGSA